MMMYLKHLTMKAGGQFLLHWGAFFGFLAGTSNCPCCGQPCCPAGAAGMGLIAGLLAVATGFFRKSSAQRDLHARRLGHPGCKKMGSNNGDLITGEAKE